MTISKTDRARLMALQHRYRSLLAMLPTDVNEIGELDISEIAGWELIATEMVAVSNAQLAILDELNAGATAAEAST